MELTANQWTISSNGVGLGFIGRYPTVTFTPTGSYSADVTGFTIYAVDTAETTKTAVYTCYSGDSHTLILGSAYYVTPYLNLDDGDGVYGQVTDEGCEDQLKLLLENASVNRGTNMLWRLYTTDLTAISTYSDVVVPGGSYSGSVTATDGSWTVSGGSATPPAVASWSASGSDFTGAVIGTNLNSNGTDKKLYFYDINITDGPKTVVDGDTYNYDAS